MIVSIAKFCHKRYRYVIAFWVLALIILGAVSGSVKPTWLDQGTLPGTESSKAIELLQKENPDAAGSATAYVGKIVFQSKDGVAAHKDDIDAYLQKLVVQKSKTKIVSFASPFDEKTGGSQISKDGTIAYANIDFKDKTKLQKAGEPAEAMAKDLQKDITVEFSGLAFQKFELPASEFIGIIAALLILLFAFGSLIAAGLPIVTALVGIGISSILISLVSNIVGIPEFTTQIAAMIAIGVGIDYALFIVTRYRESVGRGNTNYDATIEAMSTAGAAVLFAGMTVVISLLGMLFIGLEFINGIAIGTSLAVLVMLLGALTFVPALLASTVGRNIHRLSVPHFKEKPDKKGFWVKWSEFIQNNAIVSFLIGLVILVTLAIPLFSLRVGAADDSNMKKDQTVRKSYDLLAKGFGPGFNGPLLIVLDTTEKDNPEVLRNVVIAIEKSDNVESVFPSSEYLSGVEAGQIQLQPGQAAPGTTDISVIAVNPKTGPQDEKTSSLIHDLRKDVLPTALDKEGTPSNAKTYVSGFTAGNEDFATIMADRLPLFIGAVLILSFLLLMSVFRSVMVALKAVIMNLLSIGAAYGVVVAVFQWGWLSKVIGIEGAGPIEPWAPMMLFAIVFGLSMDYEVFLLSKIKEEYDDTKNNAAAVTHGLAATARVISAAALIMVFVFSAFILGDNRQVKLMGLGLSAAVFLDATIVRMLLVPATMELLGDKNWWMPGWLDKIIPQIHVERVAADKDERAAAIQDAQ